MGTSRDVDRRAWRAVTLGFSFSSPVSDERRLRLDSLDGEPPIAATTIDHTGDLR